MRFLFFAPTVQYGKYGAVLTLETLGKRWGWEKTKVWRFFKKYDDVFTLYRLPGSYGSLIFNTLYPTDTETILPEQEQIGHILDEIRKFSVNTVKRENDHQYINRLIAWYSRRLVDIFWAEKSENRVAVSDYTPKHYPQTDFDNANISTAVMHTADPIDEPKPARKKKLYSSAAPPSEF